MALGENKTPTQIDFSTWLNGENLSLKHFYGEIDTNLTFATY